MLNNCGLTRREFIKGAALIAGTAAIPSGILDLSCSTAGDSFTTLEPPPMLELDDDASEVASDRKYSMEHLWVKPLSDNRVVIGITDKLARLVGIIDSMDLLEEGSSIEKGQIFGEIGGVKMDVELISPVSGQIAQTNGALVLNVLPVNASPYTEWLEVIKLSNPEEMQELISPEEYASLQLNMAAP
jgi:glycine cleavage system H protein